MPISEGEISIMFRKPNTGLNGYWNKSEVIDASGMSCSFMEFFQWDHYGYLNMMKDIREVHCDRLAPSIQSLWARRYC